MTATYEITGTFTDGSTFRIPLVSIRNTHHATCRDVAREHITPDPDVATATLVYVDEYGFDTVKETLKCVSS